MLLGASKPWDDNSWHISQAGDMPIAVSRLSKKGEAVARELGVELLEKKA